MQPAAEGVLEIAREIVRQRYSGAACAFVAGSIMRGQGTTSSDVDLVVVFDRLDAAWREPFVQGGFPVEAFVHDPSTLAWFMDEDARNGHPVLAHMVAEGQQVGDDEGLAQALKQDAAERMLRGPGSLADARSKELRYIITDLMEDLRGDRTAAEIRAISASLYQPLADLTLLGRGVWSGKGKWVPRLLHKQDSELAVQFDEAFRAAANGQGSILRAFTESELSRNGGAFFAGDRRQAPVSARRTKESDLPT
ncbi:nucleotidyltransferase domain-containing protein [Aminobacter sp. UC22_36]|uniref:nucleotidyltransferase domain-containing protein n=1 Tax=Aminobacter sp. UC22_36 TaxID=3374549 RepID=UPI00375707D8